MNPSLFLALWPIINLMLIVAVIYFIYKWVNIFITLKEEQNDLLREIVEKMDNR